MRNRKMPQARQFDRPNGLQWEISPQALERWTPDLMAADKTENTISVLEPIGQDFWTGEGMTAKRIAGILRSIGADQDVTVLMNSPGGDLFEGMAIYNLLREHKGQVTVKVLGVAASAASIIAMAGDNVMIARAGFLMIHNTWVVAMGNRNDLRDIADTLEPFDTAMSDIYSARSGTEAKAVQKMMDKETWIGGAAAVDQGFADSLLPADEVKKDANAKGDRVAAHLLDMALAKAGMPRSERRAMLKEFKTRAPRATENTENDAAVMNALKAFHIPTELMAKTTTTKYAVGDSVKVKPGFEHDEMTKGKTGKVEEISTPALAVKFDGMPVHKWYVDAEVEEGDEADEDMEMANIGTQNATGNGTQNAAEATELMLAIKSFSL